MPNRLRKVLELPTTKERRALLRERIAHRLDQMGGRPDGFTFKWLAGKLGITSVHLSYVLNGDRKLSMDILEAIARELGVTTGWLFGVPDESEKSPPPTVPFRISLNGDVAQSIAELARAAGKSTTQFLEDFIDATFSKRVR
jgi:transcriptional regulator with XRE-family HTH domain